MGRVRTSWATIAGCALVAALAAPASATWPESSDLIYNTAHVLDEGELEFGLFSPFQYGVSDQVQIAVHPIMLLIAPTVAVRWRASPEGPLTAAVNAELTIYVLDKVLPDGSIFVDPGDGTGCGTCGLPWTLQFPGTATWELVKGLSVSGGMGPAIDVLGAFEHVRWMVEVHASVMWLIDSENLLMLHAGMNLHPWHDEAWSRPAAQLMYAHAWGSFHLGVGVAFGEFELVTATNAVTGDDDVMKWPAFPVLDIWWRI